jgi:hypothetical protein
MKLTTTLTKAFEPAHGNGANGPWTRSDFQSEGGLKFSTFKGEVASVATALIGQLVEIEYDEKQNGEYTNRTLKAVKVAAEGATANEPKQQQPASSGGSKGEFRTPAQIIRTSALVSAVQSFEAAQLDPVAQLADVLEQAVVFEKFITEGIEAEGE